MGLAIAVFLAALQADAVDGIAVSTQYRGVWNTTGDIMRYTIKNNAVSAAGKIFDGGGPRISGRFPCINKEGTQIVFFRSTSDSGWFVSLMNIDGSGVRNLVRMPQGSGYGGSGYLYWPTGRWVYYMECGANHAEGSRHLWRVNVDNLQSAEVVVFQYPIWQFGMSADATKMHLRVFEDNGASALSYYYLLPGNGSIADNTKVGDGAGCGNNLSPSGNELSYLQGGTHTWIALATWSNLAKAGGDFGFSSEQINQFVFPSSQQITNCTWSDGTRVTLTAGYGMDSNRWSTNSDKWMCLQMGWIEQPGGSGRYSFCSSNQVLLNWVDRAAINASRSGRACSDGGNFASGCDVALPYSEYRRNDAGDFWVSGPIEDINPDLRYLVAASRPRVAAACMSDRSIEIRRERGRLLLQIRYPGAWSATLADLKGVVVRHWSGVGAAEYVQTPCVSGTCLLMVKSEGGMTARIVAIAK